MLYICCSTSEKPNLGAKASSSAMANHIQPQDSDSCSKSQDKEKEGINSTVEPGGSNMDSFYCSLLFDEFDLYSDSDVEIGGVEKAKIEVNASSPALDLKDILADLARKIDLEKISIFNICRGEMWQGAKRGLTRKSFSPFNKISVKFSDDAGSSEGAVDMGGPTREFFTLVLEWLTSSHLFCGPLEGKFLAFSASCVDNSEYLYAGKIIALSLVHGGPGINSLSPVLYNALVKGVENTTVSVEDVYDHELKLALSKLSDAKSVEEGSEIKSQYKLDTILDLAGTIHPFKSVDDIKAVVKQTAHWYTLGRAYVAIEQFKEGLCLLGVLRAMESNPDVFNEVFCYRPLNLSLVTFNQIVSVCFSEEGSNRRLTENRIMSYWGDYVQDIEEAETEISFSDVVFFSTGCKKLPPLGFYITVEFLHQPEINGELSKFPKANTCGCILALPVIHKSYQPFKDAMTFAVANSKGFGYA